MSVYVDDMHRPAQIGRLRARWSHLFADSRAELDAFAVSIGLRPAVSVNVGQQPEPPMSVAEAMAFNNTTVTLKGAYWLLRAHAALSRLTEFTDEQMDRSVLIFHEQHRRGEEF